MTCRFIFRGPMKLIHIAALQITLFPAGWRKWRLLIDWNMAEIGNRWRLEVGVAERWRFLHYDPTVEGKYWAYWARGNERVPGRPWRPRTIVQ